MKPRPRIILTTIALSTALLLLTSSVGQAHVMEWSTALGLKANYTTIHSGKVVKFTARLSSDRETCVKDRRVILQRNRVTVDRTHTAPRGKAVFERPVRRTASWRVVFRGFRSGGYPHVHVCKESTSNVVYVVVVR
jgi:hypothetical protein